MSTIKSADPTPMSTQAAPARSLLRWLLPTAAALTLVVAAMLTGRYHPVGPIGIHPHMPDLGLIAIQPTIVQVHLFAALAAIVLGGVMMTSRKGRLFHRTAGWVWVSIMALVAGSSLFITGLNGDKWSFIHFLSGWTLLVLPLAVIAAKRHDVQRHRRTMMGLFYGGLLVAGALTFIPGRLMWTLFLG